MKISYNWLKEYVDHPLSPEALGDALTMSGLELEEAETIGVSLDGVVVGHVLDVKQHPNADRLTLCRVDLGTGEPVQIVCGAPNVAAGQNVPVATVGTTLMLPSRKHPGEQEAVKLKKTKLRGETSEGMICAEDELGLSDDHSGIMVLAEEATIGQPLETHLRAQGIATHDTALDLAITPNRPDAVSHIGVARDVAALTNIALTKPEVALPDPGHGAAEHVAVEIDCPEACHRYVALLVRNVEIKESPSWLKRRLTAIGLRPRNNIVDITNYVMYECGQPLHAFDFDQIAGQKIIVRLTHDEHPFTTLDGKEHTLPVGTIMICDAAREVAIGGIMGGENSEVTETTTNVLIESAYFDPSTIRRAAKTLGISTDASYRFERGVDSDGQVWAAARAAQLMVALGGGDLVPGMVDAHPTKPESRVLPLRLSRIEKILGVPVPQGEAAHILTALGFGVETGNDALFHCAVPTYRPDVEREIDLIEEVARIYGYERIPEPSHTALPNQTPRALPSDVLRRTARMMISGLGYREIYTNSMLRKEEAERFNLPILSGEAEPIVETLNPISQEMSALRPSMLPEMLRVMSFNRNHGQEVLRFYEFGHVYHRTHRTDVPVKGYTEHTSFIMMAAGPATRRAWDQQPRLLDFFDLKGDVEALLNALRLPDVTTTPYYEATPITAYHLTITSGQIHLGIIARLADSLTGELDLKIPAFFAELNWDALVELAAPNLNRAYKAVNRFPVVDRDIAVVVGRDQAVGPMMATIRRAGHPLLRDVDVFDLYEGEHMAPDTKSVAFSLRFGADRTLKDEEVDKRVAIILKRLGKTHEAVLRQ
ncbi:MAG: phenylalanine--tRNA ligase subunit beta [Rhodothermales bacterium]